MLFKIRFCFSAKYWSLIRILAICPFFVLQFFSYYVFSEHASCSFIPLVPFSFILYFIICDLLSFPKKKK